MAQVTINNITFNNVPSQKSGTVVADHLIPMTAKSYSTVQDYVNNGFTPLFDAININWNGAVLPNGSSTGGSITIERTDQLLELINNMQDEIYVLTAAVIALSDVGN